MRATPRQRVIAALGRKNTGPVAMDFGATECSSAHLIAYRNLRSHLGLDPQPLRLGCMAQLVAEADSEVQTRLGSDAVALPFYPRRWRNWDSGYGFPVEVPEGWKPEILPDGYSVIRDKHGVVLSRRAPGGMYFDVGAFSLADAVSPKDYDARPDLFARWDWPAVLDESVEEYAARARRLYAATDRAVIAQWRMHYLQAGQLLRGYEQFLVDLLVEEDMARGLLDRLHVAYMQRARVFLDALDGSIDAVFFTDDLGTQSAPLIGLETYRAMIKPYWAELIALVKARGIKVIMHACGAVSDFIPDMIEMGVDALNPVQITATGMAPERLIRDFGRDISFWGGGVSTQGTLDRATPAVIREEVVRNVGAFNRYGGYVFTPVHNIQADVPPENIVAAFQAARGCDLEKTSDCSARPGGKTSSRACDGDAH